MANSALLRGENVNGAIYRAGGPALIAEWREIRAHQRNGLLLQVVTIGVGNLPAKAVLSCGKAESAERP